MLQCGLCFTWQDRRKSNYVGWSWGSPALEEKRGKALSFRMSGRMSPSAATVGSIIGVSPLVLLRTRLAMLIGVRDAA